ncbi:MAG: gamma-glutamylcyclotransferase family protein [Oxalicibacterium faecigallinarum]|uniref:gamma-glutamylcyclotransferase family protein n=1 Tax=Oxalicibacterium faecigallinarum TaxID=573741 RepID=UPI00280819A4|nr:gamma-glutamylcyclotransferase family protein [Oxalicibacterium faecigallinarum]MDQ7968291.1 gamma-glutamylcyclotransferase family protein [Oxalicibacterium faecigallinarum]
MHVFTYGSLMFPVVWQRVVHGRYRSVPAMLPGYARYEVAGETYPGMVPKTASAVNGVLYLDVDEADLLSLDVFEGSEYRRDVVTVSVAADENLTAVTYVFTAAQRLTNRPWEADSFRITQFMDAYCRDY